LQGADRAKDAVEGFRSAAGFIRQKIGRGLGLRYSPEFEFEYDATIERAARIDALLRKEQSR
jgi:ribosome-binding factor A